jgi:hypothetical protein
MDAELKTGLETSQRYVADLVEARDQWLAAIRAQFDRAIDAQINFQRALVKGEAAPADLPRPKPNLRKPASGQAELEPSLNGGPAVEFTRGPLKGRIFRFLGVHGDAKTLIEIAEGVSEQKVRRVLFCLRDARAKDGLLEAPVDGRWTRNREGKKYSEQLLAELATEAVPMSK